MMTMAAFPATAPTSSPTPTVAQVAPVSAVRDQRSGPHTRPQTDAAVDPSARSERAATQTRGGRGSKVDITV